MPINDNRYKIHFPTEQVSKFKAHMQNNEGNGEGFQIIQKKKTFQYCSALGDGWMFWSQQRQPSTNLNTAANRFDFAYMNLLDKADGYGKIFCYQTKTLMKEHLGALLDGFDFYTGTYTSGQPKSATSSTVKVSSVFFKFCRSDHIF